MTPESPFSTLIGLSGLLLEDFSKNETTEIESILKNIHKVSTHALSLLDDLLVWGKMISDGIILQKQTFSCHVVCQELLEEFKERATLKNIMIVLNEEEPIDLNADLNMFKTIIRNLLSNALKFTSRNGVVELILKKTDSTVQVTISDNGIGINQEVQDSIWDFSRHLTTKGTEQEVGTGFGLSICKQLVEKHQGRIWVKSEKNKGSAFTFQLPV